jgi:cellulose synthase/poly-beta-1,6-N-acetylglucosamine synthase-like glycosyltransferase
MKRSLCLAFILIICSPLAAAKDNKDILVPAGATHGANINAFNSFVDIAGKVDAAVFLVGGRLRLSGRISGDVICLGSQVEIQNGAVIGRDLIVIGGRVRKDPGCKINGDFYNIRTREDLKKIARTLLPFLPESGGFNFIRISKIFFWFILALLALAILPLQVSRAADMLKGSPLRYGAIGLLALPVFILALIIFIVLCLVLIGIPLLFALMALYFLALVFGRTVVFYFIGSRLASFFKLKGNAIRFVMSGTVVYALLKILPWFGAPLLIVMDIFAIGISVGYFLKYKGLGSRVKGTG